MNKVKVLAVEHYTEKLFRIRTERPSSLRFRSGEFVMIGLEVEGKPLLRAYSIASPNWGEHLEFYSIKVPDGPLTTLLKEVGPGDEIIVSSKPVGTLVNDNLLSNGTLWLLCTGTGFAPFASILQDPETYEKFDHVNVIHTTRYAAELDYSRSIIEQFGRMEEFEDYWNQLVYVGSTTQEKIPGSMHGRITTMWDNGDLAMLSANDSLTPETDRVMLCGSIAFNADMQERLDAAGFVEGNNSEAGTYVIERAFVG